MTKLCSGQGNPDADDDDDTAAANESNPYMLPFQATQKLYLGRGVEDATYQLSLL